MAYSTQRATSDGTLVLLNLSLDYFDRTEINVLIGGVVSPSTSGKWNWVGSTNKQIAFTPAIANGVEVTIKRSTQLAAPLNQYTKGAQFIAETLDDNFNQVLRIAQEAAEGSGAKDVYNDVDYHGFKLTNVGAAVNPTDVVTLAQYQSDTLGANASKVAAAASAAAAVANAGYADASRIAAATSATNAATSETNALGSKNAAATSATNAGTSETNALASKNAAAASLVSFKNLYYGAASSAPTTRPDASAMVVGDLYFDSTLNQMRVRQAASWVSLPVALTGSSAQDFAAQTLTASTGVVTPGLNGSQLAGFRNRIINGRFGIWQRGGSISCPPGLTFCADRWILAVGGASTATAAYATFGGNVSAYPCDNTAIILTFGAGSGASNLRQRMESVATYQGQQVTVSFWAKHITGSTQFNVVFVQNFGTGGSPSADVPTFFSGQYSTTSGYTLFTFTGTIPSIAGKTLGTNGNDFLELQIQTSSNAAHTVGMTAVQVEPGPVATPFEFKPTAVELAMCQRYYQYMPLMFGNWYGTTDFRCAVGFPVTMRAAPTATVLGSASVEEYNVAFRAIGAISGGLTAGGFSGSITTAAANAAGKSGTFTGTSAGNGIVLNAEL